MEVYERECIESYVLTDDDGQQACVNKGRVYTVSAVRTPKGGGENIVVVFANYWFPVPVSCFGEAHPLGWDYKRKKDAPPAAPAPINEVR